MDYSQYNELRDAIEANEPNTVERIVTERIDVNSVINWEPSLGASASVTSDDSDDELPDVWPPVNYDPFSTPFIKLDAHNPGRMTRHVKNISKSEVYPLPRGYVLIINNRNFNNVKIDDETTLSDRDGTDSDATHMRLTMTEIGFHTNCQENRTAEQILKDAQEAASDERSKSCFICVILSHGASGGFYGIDGMFVTFEDLTDVIEKPLGGTPKIFFIQACQGNKENQYETDQKTNASTKELQELIPQSQEYITAIENYLQSLAVSDQTDSESMDGARLPRSDIFSAIATVDGYVSWRTGEGTWFIQALIYAIKRWAYSKSLDQLLTIVIKLVRKRKTLTGSKQVCVKNSTFDKEFYFFPGLTKDDIQRINDE